MGFFWVSVFVLVYRIVFSPLFDNLYGFTDTGKHQWSWRNFDVEDFRVKEKKWCWWLRSYWITYISVLLAIFGFIQDDMQQYETRLTTSHTTLALCFSKSFHQTEFPQFTRQAVKFLFRIWWILKVIFYWALNNAVALEKKEVWTSGEEKT